MSNIKIIPAGPLQTNCYIIYDKDKKAIVIDPGQDDRILDFLKENLIDVEAIMLTHGHLDHIWSTKLLRDNFPNAKVYIHKKDSDRLVESTKNGSTFFGKEFSSQGEADVILNDDNSINIGNKIVEFIYTPGHTEGCVCYIIGDCMFTGDTIFKLDVGRTDLVGGDYETLKKTMLKLKNLPKDYKIYPGHGESTTLDFEIKNNPYMLKV